MKEHRHPHPHIDPRQPRDGTTPGTNPPVFSWMPMEGAGTYRLEIAHDAKFTDVALEESALTETVYLPERALPPGAYHWRWRTGDRWSEVFTFEITPNSVTLEVPPAAEWLKRLPDEHPRLYFQPGELSGLRSQTASESNELWKAQRSEAEAVLTESHDIPEPPFLPDREQDYDAFFKVWYDAMWGSRRFVKGAEALALAYLLSGDARYGRAACQRMASISKWDPEGSSHLHHNDEAHMSVIWHGAMVCDWAWDQFSDEERALVIEQFRRRGQITFEAMHDRGSYGVTRFDSHAGREIVFLALIALVFHDHIPEAAGWLEWLRPVLCGIWPIWAGDDGGWAEGPSYGLAYVRIMTMFATALKRGTGIDLYRRPFWMNHAWWRVWCLPPYAEWMGFGDHSERWAASWNGNADLVDIIARETSTDEFDDYIAEMRREADNMNTPAEREMPGLEAQRFLQRT